MESFDPFAVLGLPRRYDVDAAAVQRAYLERSAVLHPDAMKGGDGVEQVDGDERSAALNRAKQVLDDPEQRAVALWKLIGGAADDKSLPPGFLMEMMEVREQVESGGAIEGGWEAWAEARRGEYQQRVRALFAQIKPNTPADHMTLKQIKTELNAWRYIERLIEQL